MHARSRASRGPCVVVECGSGDAQTLDRLLFGAADARGRPDLESASPDCSVVAARGGTIFLQDVTELPAAVQARLARVARDGEIRVNGRVVSTSLRLMGGAAPSIDRDVREHRFRADLYRRLSAARIDVPPLRERPEDVPDLASCLLESLAEPDAAPRRFTQSALALLAALTWPGNLAELRAVVERTASETGADPIQVEHVLPVLQLDRAQTAFMPAGSLREARRRFERDYIAAVLKHHSWRVADAAETLGIQRPNLYRKARQLGIPLSRLNGRSESVA
jgi:DNA-binding NtrC family response regulator